MINLGKGRRVLYQWCSAVTIEKKRNFEKENFVKWKYGTKYQYDCVFASVCSAILVEVVT